MEFITDNYIWFIVGGIILLMALIGYIAEKTDFGRKDKEPKVKKVKEIKKEIKEEPISIQAKGINDLAQPLIEKSPEIETNDTTLPFTDEDLFAPIAVPVVDENIDSSLYTPLESSTVPNLNETTEVLPIVEVPTEISVEEKKVPTEFVSEEPIVIGENIETEEDIWKF